MLLENRNHEDNPLTLLCSRNDLLQGTILLQMTWTRLTVPPLPVYLLPIPPVPILSFLNDFNSIPTGQNTCYLDLIKLELSFSPWLDPEFWFIRIPASTQPLLMLCWPQDKQGSDILPCPPPHTQRTPFQGWSSLCIKEKLFSAWSLNTHRS